VTLYRSLPPKGPELCPATRSTRGIKIAPNLHTRPPQTPPRSPIFGVERLFQTGDQKEVHLRFRESAGA